MASENPFENSTGSSSPPSGVSAPLPAHLPPESPSPESPSSHDRPPTIIEFTSPSSPIPSTSQNPRASPHSSTSSGESSNSSILISSPPPWTPGATTTDRVQFVADTNGNRPNGNGKMSMKQGDGYSDGGQYGYSPGPNYQHGFYESGPSSARASTIVGDGSMGPNNSSKYALNEEWRNGGDDEIAAAKGQSYAPVPPASPARANDEKKAIPVDVEPKENIAKSPPSVIISRANRLDWIDGLRGLASLIIFTHHFRDLTFGLSHPNVLEFGSLEGFLANGQLAVCMYFLLGGRVLAHGFFRSAFTKPKPLVKHGEIVPNQPPLKQPSPRWMSLASSLFRRSIRLAFPAIVVGFIQWIVAKTHAVDDITQDINLRVLHPTNMWIPTWGTIGDFWGFLQFCLDLFTNRNHQYLLYTGSALWTTYDQFWGSVLVYIVAALMAPLAMRGRYLVYGIICVALFYYNSPNILYIIGLWMADLNTSGLIRKVQDHWIPTVVIECCAMALALALIAGGGKVATPSNIFFSNWTIYDGKFGWDQSFVWPQYMLFSNWVPPTMILIWVEFSHAMQWFVSWGIFTWIGKVSYGFYLMQFLTLYGIMPHLVTVFFDDGNSYWDIVVPAFIISLICNIFLAWISYHLLDRVGLKLGKWIWDGFFVTKPNNCAALPWKFVKGVFGGLFHAPGYVAKSMYTKSSTNFTSLGKSLKTLSHWRSPAFRPDVPDPTDPDILNQLHSTRWTSDLSHDVEAVRTARLLRMQQFAWMFHIWFIPGLTFVWVYFHPTGKWTWDVITFSTIWRFIWVLSMPNCIFAYIGFSTPDKAPPKAEMDKKPVHREYIRNFFILLVTKGSNEGAVRRGYNKLIKLEKYHPCVKVVVLTDEPYAFPDIQNIVCPKTYTSPLGKAKYKARALDYFRYHVSLGVYDWILHMDEESVTDAETVRRCLDFIRYTPHHFGQGIILYNGEGFWNNWYFTVADGIRVGDDLARFHFQNTVIKRPVFGVHGSFLMTNGELENECTWDFGSLAEDFEFSQDAWRRGFTCGRIHGIVREQSPTTLRDFLKQRRRWFMGIRDIKGMYGLPNLAVNLWIVGVFTLAVTIINLPFAIIDSSLTPVWVAICADFCFITFYMLYLWGLFFQELDYGQVWWKIPMHLIPAIVIQPFASVAEGLSAIWAMSSEDFGKFEVIKKN